MQRTTIALKDVKVLTSLEQSYVKGGSDTATESTTSQETVFPDIDIM